MSGLDEATRLIQRLCEPELRELSAWLVECLDDSRCVADPAARYGGAAESLETFTPEEYLALEERSAVRHEYAAGQIYAMSEPLQPHKLICGNIFAALHAHLRGTSCRPYIQSTRVRIRAREEDYFYYPDILIACGEARDGKGRFIEEHRVAIEVMSRSTERIDRREKAYTYRELPSIEEIVLVSQRPAHVTVYRRTQNWAPAVLESLQQVLELRSVGFALPLGPIYEGLP